MKDQKIKCIQNRILDFLTVIRTLKDKELMFIIQTIPRLRCSLQSSHSTKVLALNLSGSCLCALCMSSLCDQFHFKFPGFLPQSKVKRKVDSNRGLCASSVAICVPPVHFQLNRDEHFHNPTWKHY